MSDIAALLENVSRKRHLYEAARREKERADEQLMVYLDGMGQKSVQSDELHITATVTTRRTAKLISEERCALALSEIGLILPRKEVVDTTELLAIADRYGGDFPGVEITETEFLTVKGKTR